MRALVALASVAVVLFGVAACSKTTEKPATSTPAGTNRLIHEKSPYLLQHARNPVDWYPWGPEAFERAKREDKPVFLSVGYSTCHWCHVMEHESFENPAIAKILNEHFIAVKVDREERPDVDQVFMTFVQATTGGGGWPMSVFLTPDLKPFLGGTYFPPVARYGRPGFGEVLTRIAHLWKSDRVRIKQAGEETAAALRRTDQSEPLAGDHLNPAALTLAYRAFARDFDPRFAGFGPAPKFPRPSVLEFMLRYYARSKDPKALDMTVRTLDAMARGGMHDTLAGGFHRYSTDGQWRVPHFEKMLYDQAQLAVVYLEAFQITGNRRFANVAAGILNYVLRDLRDPLGGFHSAEDADSAADPARPEERTEGACYVWTRDEVARLLTDESRELVLAYFGVTARGNAGPGELAGKNVLYVSASERELAKKLERDPAAVHYLLDAARYKLLDARAKRPRPRLDDKVLVSWNGLMISAFASGWSVLGDARHKTAAREAAGFILDRMVDPTSGELRRRYRDGDVALEALLDDYAFFIQGLLDLYEADLDVRWLKAAIQLQEKQDALFSDTVGYFDSTGRDPHVLSRGKSRYDGAEPAPNSVSALNLARLAEITGREAWRASAIKIARSISQRAPQATPAMLVALDFLLSTPTQVVVAGPADAQDTQAMLRAVHQRWLPNLILLLADGGEAQRYLATLQPAVAEMKPLNGKAAAYVCRNFRCERPVIGVDALLEGLRR